MISSLSLCASANVSLPADYCEQRTSKLKELSSTLENDILLRMSALGLTNAGQFSSTVASAQQQQLYPPSPSRSVQSYVFSSQMVEHNRETNFASQPNPVASHDAMMTSAAERPSRPPPPPPRPPQSSASASPLPLHSCSYSSILRSRSSSSQRNAPHSSASPSRTGRRIDSSRIPRGGGGGGAVDWCSSLRSHSASSALSIPTNTAHGFSAERTKSTDEHDPFYDALYEDADARRRRQEARNKLFEEQLEQLRTAGKLNRTSEFLAENRWKKTLRQMWMAFCAEQSIRTEPQRLDYEQLRLLLIKLRLVADERKLDKEALSASLLSSSSAPGSAGDGPQLTFELWAAMTAVHGRPFVTVEDFIRVVGPIFRQREEAAVASQQQQQQRVVPENPTPVATNPESTTPRELLSQFNDTAENATSMTSGSISVGKLLMMASPKREGAGGAGSRTESPRMYLNEQSAVSTQWKQDMSVNKLHTTGIHHLRQNSGYEDKDEKECTFRPSTDRNSQRLAARASTIYCVTENKRQPLLRIEAMNEQLRLIALKREEQRRVLAEQELESCTFKPSINKHKEADAEVKRAIQESKEKKARMKLDLAMKDKQMDKECTFKPSIIAKPAKVKTEGSQTSIAGLDRYLKRQQIAKEHKLERERVEESVRMGRPPHIDPSKWGINCGPRDGSKTTVPRPFHFQLEGRKRAKPLLFIDINLGGGRSGRLGIHAHDDPQALARNFAMSYRLDETTQLKLEAMLVQKMCQLVPGFRARHMANNPNLSSHSNPSEKPPAMISGVVIPRASTSPSSKRLSSSSRGSQHGSVETEKDNITSGDAPSPHTADKGAIASTAAPAALPISSPGRGSSPRDHQIKLRPSSSSSIGSADKENTTYRMSLSPSSAASTSSSSSSSSSALSPSPLSPISATMSPIPPAAKASKPGKKTKKSSAQHSHSHPVSASGHQKRAVAIVAGLVPNNITAATTTTTVSSVVNPSLKSETPSLSQENQSSITGRISPPQAMPIAPPKRPAPTLPTAMAAVVPVPMAHKADGVGNGNATNAADASGLLGSDDDVSEDDDEELVLPSNGYYAAFLNSHENEKELSAALSAYVKAAKSSAATATASTSAAGPSRQVMGF